MLRALLVLSALTLTGAAGGAGPVPKVVAKIRTPFAPCAAAAAATAVWVTSYSEAALVRIDRRTN